AWLTPMRFSATWSRGAPLSMAARLAHSVRTTNVSTVSSIRRWRSRLRAMRSFIASAVPMRPGRRRAARAMTGGMAPARRQSGVASPRWWSAHAAHFADRQTPSHSARPQRIIVPRWQMKPRLPVWAVTITRAPASLAARSSWRPRPVTSECAWNTSGRRRDRRGAAAGEPVVKARRPARGDLPLRLVPRGRDRHRITIDRDALVFVRAIAGRPGLWSGNRHVAPGRAQPLHERSHVHLGAAEALGKVPAQRLDDLHAGRRSVAPARAGAALAAESRGSGDVPASRSRRGRRRQRITPAPPHPAAAG